MRVISKSAIREFVKTRRADRDIAERDLNAWYKLADHAEWANFGQMKQSLGSADVVGRCVVFDVGNNRFRLISRVFFESQKMSILKVMDHQEYDKNRWVKDCQCHEPKPSQKADKKAAKKAAKRRKPPRK